MCEVLDKDTIKLEMQHFHEKKFGEGMNMIDIKQDITEWSPIDTTTKRR